MFVQFSLYEVIQSSYLCLQARRGQVSSGAEASTLTKGAVDVAQADEEEDGMDEDDDDEAEDAGFVSTQR